MYLGKKKNVNLATLRDDGKLEFRIENHNYPADTQYYWVIKTSEVPPSHETTNGPESIETGL